MSEDRKKKRIAHIGNIASVQGAAKLHNDDELAQADCNIVYNIMQSMDASQVMSYQQLQEFKSKENNLSRVNYSEQNSSKNGRTVISKQVKKFQEKTFPLMAKCQKSMTFLKKNRCIPKPRAHVGFIPRPPQRPISEFKLNDRYHSVAANKRLHNESRINKINKQNPKKSRRSPETSGKAKKPKISQSVENSCDKYTRPTGIFEKHSKLIINAEADSDDEFEQFLKEHHPSKCVASSNDSSDSSASSRKVKKNNRTKRKKGKQTVYLAKMRKGKVTRKTLTESEESAESQDEGIENNCIGEDDFTKESCNPQFPSKKFQRIIKYDNSDDSVSDSNLNDTGAFNCDSYNSSDDDSEHLNILPCKPSPGTSSSTALTELNDTSCNILKSKCKIPCYVVIKRDPLLEQKVASMCTDNSSVIEMKPVSNLSDDDDLSDCIIVTETNIASDNSYQRNATGIDEPLPVSEIINKNVKNTHDEKKLLNPNSCRPRTDKVMEVQKDKANAKEIISVNVSSKFSSDIENAYGKETCMITNKTTEYTHINVNTLECDEKDTLNKEKTTTEIEAFNVQILSVKSLNETDVIVLSDDSDENDMEFEPIINETNGTSTGDSDVEIICLDVNGINKEKSANENVRNIANRGLHDKANSDSNEYSLSSSIQPIVLNEEDCIVLDNAEISSENNCTSKCDTKVQRSSQLIVKSVDIINNEKKNSNNTEETLTHNVPDLDKNSILKILNTIDFNCIQKVLKETTINHTQIGKNSDSVSAKVENSLCANIETSKKTDYSFPANRNQKDACHAKEGLVNASIPCDGSSAINKTSRLKASPVDTYEKRIKFVKNDNILHSKNDVPERVTSPVKLDNVPTSNNCAKSLAFCNSNTNISAVKSSVSEKKIIATSPKTELNTLLRPQKNQQLLPRCTKVESNESTADILDVLVVKSIQNLEEKRKKTILPLVELYQTEYKKFMEIKSTEKNVTAGLKLLEENQARKLMQISSSIKNIAENDKCFHKVKNKFVSNRGEHSFPVKTDGSLIEVEKPVKCQPGPSNSTWSDIKKDAKVKIFSDAVIEGASEILNLQAVGPASSQKVYNHLINSVCVECGKHAMAACLGCAKVFYCSEKCGMSYWDKGHYATCKR